jgi:hypothetical protein
MAAVAVALVAPLRATAQDRAPRTSVSPAAGTPPGLATIREADLRRDMEALAGDAMRGREAGTLDELRASAWLAERARAAGLEPAGEDGTYFQFWPMRRAATSPASRASYDGARPVTEAVVATPADATSMRRSSRSGGRDAGLSAARQGARTTLRARPADLAGRTKRNDTFIYTLLACSRSSAASLEGSRPRPSSVYDSIADAGFRFPSTPDASPGANADRLGRRRAHARRAKVCR